MTSGDWAIVLAILGSTYWLVAELRHARDKICRHLDTLHQDYCDWRNPRR